MIHRTLALPRRRPPIAPPVLSGWHAHAAAYTVAAVAAVVLQPAMDFYEHVILLGAYVACVLLAPARPALSRLLLAGLALGGGAIALTNRAPTLAGSQTLILALVSATWVATAMHLAAWWRQSQRMSRAAHATTVFATLAGIAGLLARWHESYHVGAGAGHVPISNLYEVFVLFTIVCSVIQLELLRDAGRRALAAFVGPAASAAAGFLVWYAVARQAQALQPLVPALDSYWMKLHVPANFIGYGAFCAAAMVAAAWLLAAYPAVAHRLPSRAVMEQLMYRLIAVGFVFFTTATVLGALWAAEAWGSYWSWDPKETWALIVWLNYGAWLHLRLVKGSRGAPSAWWALMGLLVTLFAFLGVNMYLSGLHSYGKL